MLELTVKQAAKLAIISQGLHQNDAFGQGLDGTLAAFKQLSYIQIDSISVIQRAHHHCLWSRVNNYQPSFIDQLVAQKKVFEYWSHAAAYLPMQDYRFSLVKKGAIASGEKHWREKNPVAEKRVLKRIQEEGPLRAKDFEPDKTKKGSGWWDWKPDKVALEQLFIEGELMVAERQGFQKVYDLTERVLPETVDTSTPSTDEYADYLIRRYLNAHGIGNVEQISYLRKGWKKPIKLRCQQLFENGELRQVIVGGKQYLALPNVADLLTQKVSSNKVSILSPFDNLVIQRKRLSELLGFDYQIECYVPPAKRQYGYFSLPILWGAEFAGRMDAKIDRKSKTLHLQNLHLETPKTDAFFEVFTASIKDFLMFNGGKQIAVHKVSGNQLSASLLADVKQRLQKIEI